MSQYIQKHSDVEYQRVSKVPSKEQVAHGHKTKHANVHDRDKRGDYPTSLDQLPNIHPSRGAGQASIGGQNSASYHQYAHQKASIGAHGTPNHNLAAFEGDMIHHGGLKASRQKPIQSSGAPQHHIQDRQGDKSVAQYGVMPT